MNSTKNKYIAPQTEVIVLKMEGPLLQETRYSTSPNDKTGIGIKEGDPPDGVNLAKPNNSWGGVSDWNDDWSSAWSDEK